MNQRDLLNVLNGIFAKVHANSFVLDHVEESIKALQADSTSIKHAVGSNAGDRPVVRGESTDNESLLLKVQELKDKCAQQQVLLAEREQLITLQTQSLEDLTTALKEEQRVSTERIVELEEQLVSQNDQTLKVVIAQGNVAELQQRLAEANEAAQDTNNRVAELEEQLALAKQQLSENTTEDLLQKTQAELEEKSAEKISLEEKLTSIQQELADNQEELKKLSEQLALKEAASLDSNNVCAQLTADLEKLAAQHEKDSLGLTEAAAETENRLTQRVAELEAEVEQFSVQIERNQAEHSREISEKSAELEAENRSKVSELEQKVKDVTDQTKAAAEEALQVAATTITNLNEQLKNVQDTLTEKSTLLAEVQKQLEEATVAAVLPDEQSQENQDVKAE